jgi:c-di-GMP-binding flagellar brake protein YcgR
VRKSLRVPTSMPLVFQVVDGKHVLPEFHRGQLTDISYSGMRVMLKNPVPANTEIKCSVALSLMSPEVTDIYARILRVTESSLTESSLAESVANTEPHAYECNLEFTSIDPYGQRAVHEFVDRCVS